MKINLILPALITLALIVSGCTSYTQTAATTTIIAVPTTTISTTSTAPTTTIITATATTQTAQVKEFSITASQWKFEPNVIAVKQGDTVRLRIQSVDVTHGFNLPDFGVNRQLEPGKTIVVEFTASKKGTFTFSCSVVCGSGHSGMTGRLVVE